MTLWNWLTRSHRHGDLSSVPQNPLETPTASTLGRQTHGGFRAPWPASFTKSLHCSVRDIVSENKEEPQMAKQVKEIASPV